MQLLDDISASRLLMTGRFLAFSPAIQTVVSTLRRIADRYFTRRLLHDAHICAFSIIIDMRCRVRPAYVDDMRSS